MNKRKTRGALALLLSGMLLLQVGGMTAYAVVPGNHVGEPGLSMETEGQSWAEGGGESSENLFAQYVERELGSQVRDRTPAQTYSSDDFGVQLTGLTAQFYQALKPKLEEVAEGSRTSTEITLTLEELGLDGTFTAEDLGIEAIVQDGRFTQEAVDAIEALTYVNLSALLDALLGDCPLELYWFDKTRGVSMLGVGYRGNSSEIWLTSDFVLKFYVSSEFALNGSAFETDASKTGIVQTVKETAQGIVDKYQGAQDWEKLSGYSQEICAMVEYNHDAAYNPTPYGNPWQLLWVFDGDTTTNVVCEGYAKAFQYLCELTWFRGDVTSYLVTGTMDGGAHMWNLVVMEDGKSYLVDVTNCDQGAYMDWLFLKGCSNVSSDGFTCSGIRYVYDADIHNWFTPEQLLMSTTDYVPGEGQPSAWIQGTATSYGDESVQPVVQVLDQQGMTVVDTAEVKDGTYRTHALEPGTYVLEVSKEHHATRRYTVQLGDAAVACHVTICLMGDANGDGRINTIDVGLLNGYVKKTVELTEYQLACGDTNGDGNVNTLDVGRVNAHVKQMVSLW